MAVALVGYLSALAVRPSAADGLPTWLRWFGQPGDWPTIAIVVAVLTALSVLSLRSVTARGRETLRSLWSPASPPRVRCWVSAHIGAVTTPRIRPSSSR